jgi:hypothetical protein
MSFWVISDLSIGGQSAKGGFLQKSGKFKRQAGLCP